MAPSPADAAAQSVKVNLSATGRRLSAYLRRLPLLTRAVVLAIPIAHLLAICGMPLEEMWSLDPTKMDLSQMHRLNTYPLVHTGLIHALVNIVALTPLLERFEREIGTLKTTLLIAGPVVTFPAGLYLLIEMGVLRGSEAVVGASALVFTLIAAEAVKTYVYQPYYTIAGWEIPSWTTPIFWMMLASFLVPSSSLLGHFCGMVIGYAYACRYLRLLEPSEWILTKVEQKLGFLLLRLPWYIDLEKRVELNHMEMLPMASPATHSSAMETGAGGFTAPGRTLGTA